jgi:Protein of unknown function (DUF3037)
MNKIFKYTLLKYRPSSVLDEQVNIGILFIFSEDNQVFFSYPEHLARLSALFPDVDLNDVKHYLSAIKLKANKLSNKDLLTKTKMDDFIEKEFFVADANSFFFSDFKIGVYETEAIERMVTHFTNQYFVNYA